MSRNRTLEYRRPTSNVDHRRRRAWLLLALAAAGPSLMMTLLVAGDVLQLRFPDAMFIIAALAIVTGSPVAGALSFGLMFRFNEAELGGWTFIPTILAVVVGGLVLLLEVAVVFALLASYFGVA